MGICTLLKECGVVPRPSLFSTNTRPGDPKNTQICAVWGIDIALAFTAAVHLSNGTLWIRIDIIENAMAFIYGERSSDGAVQVRIAGECNTTDTRCTKSVVVCTTTCI